MEIMRRQTKVVSIGNVKIGGDHPISIQSMTKTDTLNIRQTVTQIQSLQKAGCEIVRIAVKDLKSACALREIRKRVTIPLEVDIHFDYRLALEAIDTGADAIRLNPGNINKASQIKMVVKKAKEYNIAIRVGVNSGSLYKGQGSRVKGQGCSVSESMVQSALGFIKLLEDEDFYGIIVSLKSSDVLTTVEAYRKMRRLCEYPFHLGVTATGLPSSGAVKSAIGIGSLLLQGIGDTIRVSLTGRPEEEVKLAKQILSSLGLRRFGPQIISCPTCGRCEVDLIKIVKKLEDNLSICRLSVAVLPVKIAVMGCVVNGPGEAKDADIGVACGKGVGLIFKKGKVIKKVKENAILDVLLQEIQKGGTGLSQSRY